MIEKTLRANLLYDFYGSLLTEKQREILELYYENDLSLSEIAADTGISRQAVHDSLHRAETILEEYEAKLQLIAKDQARRQRAAQWKQEVRQWLEEGRSLEQVAPRIQEEIECLLEDESETP